ncbi:MAG TPA: hypothetical protein VKD08_02055, partial [Ignavibacteriaceae bacterium]|nr:hypothetical protein [Ignavibacteriaceae bacterium]
MYSIPKAVEDYLKKYGLNDWAIETPLISGINNVVVVPAIAEFENLKKFLKSFINQDPLYFDSTLLIFVVNNTNSSGDEVKLDNQQTLIYLRNIMTGSP